MKTRPTSSSSDAPGGTAALASTAGADSSNSSPPALDQNVLEVELASFHSPARANPAISQQESACTMLEKAGLLMTLMSMVKLQVDTFHIRLLVTSGGGSPCVNGAERCAEPPEPR